MSDLPDRQRAEPETETSREARVRTRTVEVREGEYLGPVDWSYDFTQHDWSGSRGGMNPQASQDGARKLRELEEGIARGEAWEATTDGGMPRCGWGRVAQVGMYDGWPHWKPTPSVFICNLLGGSWHPFYSVTDIRRADHDRDITGGESEDANG